jgi:hypothetical protein
MTVMVAIFKISFMRTNRKTLLAICAVCTSLFLTACHKENKEEDISTVTKEHIAGTYKVTSLLYTPAGGAQVDVLPLVDNCQKGVKQTFNTDMTYQLDIACDPTNNQSGTWSLPSTTKIMINDIEADILSFDGHTLKLSTSNFPGANGTVIETMTK